MTSKGMAILIALAMTCLFVLSLLIGVKYFRKENKK